MFIEIEGPSGLWLVWITKIFGGIDAPGSFGESTWSAVQCGVMWLDVHIFVSKETNSLLGLEHKNNLP